MRSFFIGKHAYLIKFSPFHLMLALVFCLLIASQTIVGIFYLMPGKEAQAEGNSYYVDGSSIGGTCNNNNLGTITQPWCTIAKATGNSSPVVAGDTIYLRAGTYAGTVDFYKSGVAGNPITLTAYQNETVNINGEIRFDPNAIGGYLAENWTISKLNITNPNRDGIHITNGNHTGTITIDSCNISHNKANGIVTGWGNHNVGTIIIKNNTIQYNDNGHEDGNSGIIGYASGTYIIQNNNISYNGDPNRTSSGNKGINFYAGAYRCTNCLMENNIIQNNLETGLDFHGSNSIIRNNLIIGNGQLDTETGEYGDNGLSMQAYAVNNKVYNNIIASSGGYELSISGSGNEYYNNTLYKDYSYTATPVPANHYYSTVMIWNSTGNIFRNNVIVNMLDVNNRQFLLETYEFSPTLYANQTWSNNLYYSSYGAQGNNYIKINGLTNLAQLQALGQDQNSLFAEPAFINGPSHDFHLMENSQGIDHGYNLVGIVATDYNGTARPQGQAYDMGVYEYFIDPNININTNTNTNSNSNTNINTNSNTNLNTNQGGGGTNSNTNYNSNINSNTNTNINPGPEPTNQEGRLVKTSNNPTVYYLSETNHDRYTFPDENVFYSWYYDFNSVETISSSELLAYPLIGNVTIRPGTHLIKVTANPKVYAIEPGGVLRWIVDEQIFYGLGYNFSRVIDVPEVIFQNYVIGDDLTCACQHPNGALIKYPNNQTVYYWDGNNKRPFANEGAFWQNHFYWENVLNIANSFLYPMGAIISDRETNFILSW